MLLSPGTPGEGSGVRVVGPAALPVLWVRRRGKAACPTRGATCPHPRPLSRSTGRGEQYALTPDPSPGVPGERRRTGSLACPEGLVDRQGCLSYEGSNMPSPPTRLPEYRERGGIRSGEEYCPHPRPLSRSTGRGEEYRPHPRPLSQSTGRGGAGVSVTSTRSRQCPTPGCALLSACCR